MTRHRSTIAFLLVFALAVGIGIASVAQAGGTDRTWTFKNPNATGDTSGRVQPFTHSPTEGLGSCSGECNCNVCTCSGGFECCLVGCIICFDIACSI